MEREDLSVEAKRLFVNVSARYGAQVEFQATAIALACKGRPFSPIDLKKVILPIKI